MAIEFNKFALPQLWFTEDYTRMLLGLLPKGMIWVLERFVTTEIIQDIISGDTWQDTYTSPDEVQDVITAQADGSLLNNLMSCFASELERLEADAWRLLNSTDPGYATDLLEDWERVQGLPEICLEGQNLTLDERQRNAHAKLFDTYKTANAQFYIDYAASLGFEITIGEAPATPRIMGVARMGVERMSGSRGSSAYSIMEITIVSGTGNSDLLKCAFNRVKQAHVQIIWVE